MVPIGRYSSWGLGTRGMEITVEMVPSIVYLGESLMSSSMKCGTVRDCHPNLNSQRGYAFARTGS